MSDDPDEERIFRDLWKDETQREVVIESLKVDCEVRTGGLPVFKRIGSRRSEAAVYVRRGRG